MFLFSGILVSMIFVFRNYYFFRYSLKIILISSIFLLVIFITFNDAASLIFDRFSSLNFQKYSAFSERTDNWKVALNSLQEQPFGYGLGVGGQINLDNYKSYQISGGITVIDGFYIKLLAETGLIGILSFMIFIFLSIIQLINSIVRSENTQKAFHVVTLSILIGFCMQSIGSNPFDFITVSPILWILLGLSNNLYANSKNRGLHFAQTSDRIR